VGSDGFLTGYARSGVLAGPEGRGSGRGPPPPPPVLDNKRHFLETNFSLDWLAFQAAVNHPPPFDHHVAGVGFLENPPCAHFPLRLFTDFKANRFLWFFPLRTDTFLLTTGSPRFECAFLRPPPSTPWYLPTLTHLLHNALFFIPLWPVSCWAAAPPL